MKVARVPPPGDPGDAVRRGELPAELHGEKLRGRLVLVRREDGEGQGGAWVEPVARRARREWLLLHKRDGYAVEGWGPRSTRAP
jgi:bifunctional non-homologous end joining protein LigD